MNSRMTDNGHYTYDIVLVDENDRIVKTVVSADSAMEAVCMAKRTFGRGWSVRKLELCFAN